jgi:hypothetical protein
LIDRDVELRNVIEPTDGDCYLKMETPAGNIWTRRRTLEQTTVKKNRCTS